MLCVEANRRASPNLLNLMGPERVGGQRSGPMLRTNLAGLLPSMGAVGTCFDNAMMESFWSRVQVELLDRQAWSTRLELATALFDYRETFHDRQRRHSSPGMLTAIDFEAHRESAAMSTGA